MNIHISAVTEAKLPQQCLNVLTFRHCFYSCKFKAAYKWWGQTDRLFLSLLILYFYDVKMCYMYEWEFMESREKDYTKDLINLINDYWT